MNILDKTITSRPWFWVSPEGWFFQLKKKSVWEGVLVVITKGEAKLDEHFYSNWPKTSHKTPKKIFPVHSANVHTTSC